VLRVFGFTSSSLHHRNDSGFWIAAGDPGTNCTIQCRAVGWDGMGSD
jgi:hypothetical protein